VTTTPKLLPCPFCGGEARLYRKPWSGHGEGGEYSVVACKSCPADVQAQDYTPDDARAIELWNARLAPLPASEWVPETASAFCTRMQQKCSDWGTYWRAPDAHGVDLTNAQAVELLADVLGVEVAIAALPPSEPEVG
jgi:Lar family restriction alleviation protein